MKTLVLIGLCIGVIAVPATASAMRCKGKLVREGDTVTKMIKYCGVPSEIAGSTSIIGDKTLYIYDGYGKVRTTVVVRDNIIKEII